ncbi:MAG: DUF2306 domain-containing protein, partial [Pseudomonadota bacterium]
MELLSRFWSDSWVGQGHFVLAAIALILGPLIFTQRKGTAMHRGFGYAYLTAMLVVNVTALTMYDMTRGPNLFHFFAVVSLGTITPGLIAILRGSLTSHYFFMSWSYFGLL